MMNVCAQCGTPGKPGDKFCAACGGHFVAAPPGYGAPGARPGPPQGAGGGGYGAPPGPARCQLGHEIPPGQSYCSQGHPIALDAMQFTGDLYAAPPGYGGGYGQPPPQQPPPQQQQPQGYPPPQQQYAPVPLQQQMAPPQQMPPQIQQVQQQVPQQVQQRTPYATNAPPPGYDQTAPPQAPVAQRLPQNALRGFLVSYQANLAGDFWPLRGGRLTVGRIGSNDGLDIPLADATISSRHASILVDGTTGLIILEDTGSTNGTFVNEEHLGFNGRRELRDGDTVRFGGFNTVVKIVSDQR